jgi:uncharacterized membrane protein
MSTHLEIHPLFVHFPIALTIVAALMDWGRWIFNRERLLAAGFWSGSTPVLVFALCGSILAILTGLQAEEGVVTSVAIGDLLEAHETSAFITGSGLAILTFWRIALRGRFPARYTLVYLVVLLFIAVVVAYGAYFGGLMVYSHGVGVDRAL